MSSEKLFTTRKRLLLVIPFLLAVFLAAVGCGEESAQTTDEIAYVEITVINEAGQALATEVYCWNPEIPGAYLNPLGTGSDGKVKTKVLLGTYIVTTAHPLEGDIFTGERATLADVNGTTVRKVVLDREGETEQVTVVALHGGTVVGEEEPPPNGTARTVKLTIQVVNADGESVTKDACYWSAESLPPNSYQEAPTGRNGEATIELEPGRYMVSVFSPFDDEHWPGGGATLDDADGESTVLVELEEAGEHWTVTLLFPEPEKEYTGWEKKCREGEAVYPGYLLCCGPNFQKMDLETPESAVEGEYAVTDVSTKRTDSGIEIEEIVLYRDGKTGKIQGTMGHFDGKLFNLLSCNYPVGMNEFWMFCFEVIPLAEDEELFKPGQEKTVGAHKITVERVASENEYQVAVNDQEGTVNEIALIGDLVVQTGKVIKDYSGAERMEDGGVDPGSWSAKGATLMIDRLGADEYFLEEGQSIDALEANNVQLLSIDSENQVSVLVNGESTVISKRTHDLDSIKLSLTKVYITDSFKRAVLRAVPVPSVATLETFTLSANWDADPATDGLEVDIMPRDGQGNLLATDATLTVELWLQKSLFEAEKVELLQTWENISLGKDEFVPEIGARIRLEYNFQPNAEQYGVLEVTLTTPDGSTATAREESIWLTE